LHDQWKDLGCTETRTGDILVSRLSLFEENAEKVFIQIAVFNFFPSSNSRTHRFKSFLSAA